MNKYIVLNSNLVEIARFSRKREAENYANVIAMQFKEFCTIKEIFE